MNNIISTFAKICACTAVVIGAPLIASSAIDFATTELNKELEYRACLRTAELDNRSAGEDLFTCKR
jgi:hypothetical protein